MLRFGPVSMLFMAILLFTFVEVSLFSAFSSAREELHTARLQDRLNPDHQGLITLVLDKTEASQLNWSSDYDFEYNNMSFHVRSKQKLSDGGMVIQCEAAACFKSEPDAPTGRVEQKNPERSNRFSIRHVLGPFFRSIEHLVSGFGRVRY